MRFFQTGTSLRTKICGLTSAADARRAVDAGADALGFNFFLGSKRFLDFEENRVWISALGSGRARIAVVVNPSEESLAALRDSASFEAVQFHGDESPEFCAAAGFPIWIRATRVKDEASLAASLRYDTPYLLLDAWSAFAYGGTGQRLDWDLVRDFVIANPDRRFILAGGLTPHNVREAVRRVRPHAVDVASGVEREPRHKDDNLMRQFLKEAQAA
jgi:phosphoribosylanthranilate isomerase